MYDRICTWDNLLSAYRKAAKGKRGHPNVAAFEYRLEDNLLELQSELRRQVYRPGQYDSFYIHEPKRRLISAAPFRDRVVHHALCNWIEPLDERVLWLCSQIQASGQGVLAEEYQQVYFAGDDLLAALRPRGLPIGNLTSQFWANVYLNGFDHFVQRELGCRAYVRYVDDFLLFSTQKSQLWEWKSAIEARLARLRLTIHPGAQPRPVTEGFPFLGFLIFPRKRRLKRRKGIYFQRKLKQLIGEASCGKRKWSQVTASVQGWVNYVRFGNTVGLRKAVLGHIMKKSNKF